jgi:hypothetical protein
MAESIEIVHGSEPFGIKSHVENVQAHKYYVWIEADRRKTARPRNRERATPA